MKYCTNNYLSREEWLNGRRNSVGASECAIACGEAKFKSRADLWEEKTGRKDAPDLSDNELVQYGTEAEKYLRGLFALKHKELKVAHHPYKVFYTDEKPFMTCTLDGEILKTETGEKGILEIKTKSVLAARDLEFWEGQIPDNYYYQILQQFYCTGYDFIVVYVELRFPNYHAELREYWFERKDREDDIAYVAKSVSEFWEYVKQDKRPPERLSL